jgi:hypothetical protein
MNLERINQWVAILANLGVFAGFVLVAYQLQQNSQALVSASSHTTAELFSNGDIAMIGDTGYVAFAKALDEPQNITRDELVQLWSYLSLSAFSASQVYDDYRQGIIPESEWIAARELFISYFNHSVGRLWWKLTMADTYAESSTVAMVASVEEGLAQVPKNLTQQQFRRWHEAVSRLGEPERRED